MYNEYEEYYDTEDHLLALVYGSCEDYISYNFGNYKDYEVMEENYQDEILKQIRQQDENY